MIDIAKYTVNFESYSKYRESRVKALSLGRRLGRATLFVQIFIVLASMMWFYNQAWASTYRVAGVSFEPEKVVQSVPLRLQGSALFKYLSIIKVVAGSLYLPDATAAADVLADVPKSLEFEYFVAIKAKDFAKATHEGIKRNVSPELYRKVYDRIEKLNRLYRNVKAGDRYTLSYIPGKGTSLSLNGVELGTVEGADFASALYTIWLGEKEPMDRDFRLALLNPNK